MHRLIVLFACALTFNARCTSAQPQGRDRVSGEIQFELDATHKDPFPAMQDKVISSIRSASLSSLSQSELIFLNSAYLYCTVNKGTCPEILDALLFADVTTSKAQNKATCPLLESFWKQWIDNQFEERQRYMGKITFFSQTNDFNSKKRNGYIKCRETIGQILSGQAAAPTQDVNSKAVAILEQIKITIPNVIEHVGVQAKRAAVAAAPEGAGVNRSQPSAGAPAPAAPVVARPK